MAPSSPDLYRAALDLVTARQHDDYELFEDVLTELVTEHPGTGVSGLFAVTHLSVRQASIVARCAPGEVLGHLVIQPVPAAEPVVPAVLTLLYTATEDLTAAGRLARDLGDDERAEASMVVLADVSVAMADRVAGFAGLAGQQVVAAWRQQTETMLAAERWAA